MNKGGEEGRCEGVEEERYREGGKEGGRKERRKEGKGERGRGDVCVRQRYGEEGRGEIGSKREGVTGC